MSVKAGHKGLTLENYFDIFLGKNITRDLALDIALKDSGDNAEKAKGSQMRMEAVLDPFGEKEWFNPELDDSDNFDSFPCLALSVRAVESDYLTLEGMKRIRVLLRENAQGEIIKRDSKRLKKQQAANLWFIDLRDDSQSSAALEDLGSCSKREQQFNEKLRQFLLQDECLVRDSDVLMRCTASQGCDFNAVAITQASIDQWNKALKLQIIHEELLEPDGTNEVLPGTYSLDSHPEDGIPAGLLSVYLKTSHEAKRRYRWIPVRSSHHSFVIRPKWGKKTDVENLSKKEKEERREAITYLRSYITTSHFQEFVQTIASDGLLRRIPLKQLKNGKIVLPGPEEMNKLIKMFESLETFRVRGRMTTALMDDILTQALNHVTKTDEVGA